MVRIIHEWNGERAEEEATGLGAGMFLLPGKEAFFSLGGVTKYNGLLHLQQDRLVRSIENIFLQGELSTVRTAPGAVERRYTSGAMELFRMRGPCLQYEVTDYQGEVFLDLDMRRLDDSDTRGRVYDVRIENGAVSITYTKYTDDSCAAKEYSLTLTVAGAVPASFRRIGEWQERRYAYDARRGDSAVAWVYRAGAFKTDGVLTLTFILDGSQSKGGEVEIPPGPLPAAVALASLDGLVTTEGFIMAGLPWFCQPWSRDELVSLGAFIRARRYSFAKATILRYAALLEKKATLDAYYPSGGLTAADARGWLALRTHQLLSTLEEQRLLGDYFSKRELELLRDRIVGAMHKQGLCESGLCLNGPCETWMDTNWGGDTREGARLEIQALRATGFRLCHYLFRKTHLLSSWKCREQYEAFLRTFHDAFFVDGRLCDGVKDGARDETQRPNVFLAYYLAPELLLPAEWKSAFDSALSRLWLPWGGLATIDMESPLFAPRYTGMDNRSYHRGDSWYWLNAVAAMAMKRLDAVKYGAYIDKIRAACVNDMLFQGVVGHCSELSSAAEQEWGGCFSQAWSAAMLYELLME